MGIGNLVSPSKMNSVDFDMDSEFMEKIEDFIQRETEEMREKMLITL